MNGNALRSTACLVGLALLAACQSSDEGEDTEDRPEPVAAEDMEPVDLPDDLAELADLMDEQMGTAQTVRVEASVEEGDENTAPVEETVVDLRLGEPPAALMEITESGGETTTVTNVVVLDDVIYTELNGQEFVEGKPWTRLSHEDVAAVEDQLGPFAEIFTVVLDEVAASLEQASGDESLALVRYGEPDSDPGPAEDDSSLTEYTGQTDPQDLADAGVEDMAEFADSGVDTVEWSLTVTDRGLPHDYTVRVPVPDDEESVTTVSYRDWGQDLEVEPPPEDETTTLEEILQS